jgi:S1-C subfamily serine protease
MVAETPASLSLMSRSRQNLYVTGLVFIGLCAAHLVAADPSAASTPPVIMGAHQVVTTPLSDIEFDLRMRETASPMASVEPSTGLRTSAAPLPTIASAYVRAVRPNSRAGQAGIKVGDQILQVQGRPLAGLTHEQFKALFLLPFGDVYHVTIKRNRTAKPEEIGIPLRVKKPIATKAGEPPTQRENEKTGGP